jgi:hypothetical protein
MQSIENASDFNLSPSKHQARVTNVIRACSFAHLRGLTCYPEFDPGVMRNPRGVAGDPPPVAPSRDDFCGNNTAAAIMWNAS